ncbi:MAG: DUF1269 domain-containing protein [Gemmatimonadaceae bacterium]
MTVPSGTPGNPTLTRKIIVASFVQQGGAKLALDQLKNAGVRLGNAAVIEHEISGKVSFHESKDWGLGKSAAVGALAAIILPGIGAVMGALAGGMAAYFIDAGFPDPLLRQMGGGLEPGSSMLVALVSEGDLGHAESTLVAAGGTVLGSGFEPDLEAAMAKIQQRGT